MLFHLIDSSWKVVSWAVAVIFGHVIWFHICHDPVVLQRCGAALIVLGVVVAAQRFIREGTQAAVDGQIPPLPVTFLVPHETTTEWNKQRKAMRPQLEKDVRAERVWGFGLIIVGTLLNGYGDLPLKWMGYFAK
jgi:hypothetical protein